MERDVQLKFIFSCIILCYLRWLHVSLNVLEHSSILKKNRKSAKFTHPPARARFDFRVETLSQMADSFDSNRRNTKIENQRKFTHPSARAIIFLRQLKTTLLRNYRTSNNTHRVFGNATSVETHTKQSGSFTIIIPFHLV